MSQERAAAQAIDNLQRLFGGLLDIKPELLNVAALKQSADEAEGRRVAADLAAEQAMALVREREGHVARSQGQAEKLIADAKGAAEDILAEARQRAAQVVGEANAENARVRQAARVEASRAAQQLDAAQRELRDIKAATAAAIRERDQVAAEIAALKQRLGA